MSPPVLTPVLDMTLPDSLEAHEPPEARGLARDAVRLLVSFTDSDRVEHAQFRDLPGFLQPGDLLVINMSATLPAALTARRENGSEVQAHLSTRLQAGLTVVEFRGSNVSAGEKLILPGGGGIAVLAPYPGSQRLWVTRLELPEPLLPYLGRWGRPIAYPYIRGSWPIEMYQNVYATVPGSAEMPSAGRPFTAEMMDRLARGGVFFAPVILHTGVSSLEHEEPPYEEYFEVSHEAVAAIQRAKHRKNRVIAVGTTAVRALESAVDKAGRPIPTRGWTDLVINPERHLQLVDGLLTGFHEPKATHLAILEALVRRERLARVYQAALGAGYLWHEFGDLHLILPDAEFRSKP
jgi:S-adenosylmethionine:tRNA ribosyltransferase-isomerase